MFLSIGMLKQKYFLTDIFILSAEKQPIKLSWRKIEWLRIKDTAIGAPVKGRFIESLFIGPTDWEQMTDFMNLRIQKGEETALTEFDSAGKSLSVYGVSVNNEFDVPHWDMAIMDNWELMIGN